MNKRSIIKTAFVTLGLVLAASVMNSSEAEASGFTMVCKPVNGEMTCNPGGYGCTPIEEI